MAHDAFISHSAQDKAVADAVCATLEGSRIRCWVAPRDILPGQAWGEAIVDAIGESRVMVVIFSSHSNRSRQVVREVEQAVKRGVAILPLRIEDVSLSKEMDYFLGTTHWLDAVTPPIEKHLQQLAGTVKLLLSRIQAKDTSKSSNPSDSAPAIPQSEPSRSARLESEMTRSRRMRFPPILLILLAIVVTGSVCFHFLYMRGRPYDETVAPDKGKAVLDSDSSTPLGPATQSVVTTPLIPDSPSPSSHPISAASAVSANGITVEEPSSFLTFTGHRRAVMCLAFSPDGKLLVSGGDDMVGDNPVNVEKHVQEQVWNLVTTGSKNQGAVRLWDAVTGEEKWTLWGAFHAVNSVAIAQDGKTLASVSGDESVRVCSVQSGTILRILSAPQNSIVKAVCFSANGKWIAGGLLDRRVVIWNSNTGELKRTMTKHTSAVTSIAFSHDGGTLASASEDRTVALYDPESGELKRRLSGHHKGVTCVAFSPDDRFLATGSADTTVIVWDVASGEPKISFTAHSDEVNTVAFSHDGKLLASAADDQQVLVWDMSKTKLRWRLIEHTKKVATVAFSPVEHTLASASWDQQIKLWRLE